MSKTRKIQPNDVVIAAIKNSDREDAIETLQSKMIALEDLLCKIVSQFTPAQQLLMYEQIAGTKYSYEGLYRANIVELTADDAEATR